MNGKRKWPLTVSIYGGYDDHNEKKKYCECLKIYLNKCLL